MNAAMCLDYAIQYMEDHMQEKITVDALARAATLSPFYFHRLFTRVVGTTAMGYLKSRRLTRAAREIRRTNQGLNHIAQAVGYDHYESFSRDFKREFSVSPSRFREDRSLALVYTPRFDLSLHSKLLAPDEIHAANGMLLHVHVVPHQEAVYAIGISKLAGLTKGVDDPGMLWGRFTDEVKSHIPNQTLPCREFGIGMSGPPGGGFTYFVGRQVASLAHLPEGYASCVLPAASYAVCSFEAETFELLTNEALYTAGRYMLGTWLPHRLGRPTAGVSMAIEVYDESSASAQPPRMEYWFPLDIE